MPSSLNIETAVRNRYSAAAGRREEALCCPVDYNREHLDIIPAEVIEKDYGCGDPSRHVRSGETVLDLGSGTGKICFIAAQVVGPQGRVIGVDLNQDMLDLARKHQPAVEKAMGYRNLEFRKGRIQDLSLNLELLDQTLRNNPVHSSDGFLALEETMRRLRQEQPLVADGSIDVVVSNCVLNLVESGFKRQLFHEIYRVLKPGGRAVISDIASDLPVPDHLQSDPELWSGCISGALTESGFLDAFSDAGFHGIRILQRGQQPWQTVEEIEFRAVTVEAFKAPVGESSMEGGKVMYRGPFKEVVDDAGQRFVRGEICEVEGADYNRLQNEPYRESFELIGSRSELSAAASSTACCEPNACCQ